MSLVLRRLTLSAMLGLAAVGPSSHRDPSQLRPGLFLYASPAQQDPNFAESVVLLVEHGPQGSMGLVVNRPTSVPLRELLRGVEGLGASDLRFYWGGPVQPEAILALVRTPRPSTSARSVLPDVHLTGELADVRAALAEKEPGERLRVFTGYAGWGKGQLAAEVRAGAWVLDRADSRSIFAPDTSELWFRVHRILERLEARSGRRPPRPRAVNDTASEMTVKEKQRRCELFVEGSVMAENSSAARDAGIGVLGGYRHTFGAP